MDISISEGQTLPSSFGGLASPMYLIHVLQAYTGLLNLIEYVGSYIPAFIYNSQVLFLLPTKCTCEGLLLLLLGGGIGSPNY